MMDSSNKSSVAEIRARFDHDVERFSQLETGQTATMDSALCLDLVARAAVAASAPVRQVLDVGCGAGNYSLKLRELAPEAKFTLADLSAPMLERARQRLGDAVSATAQGDIRAVDFPAASFDVVLAAAVLHHLRTPEEWRRVFTAFHRWLRPGGSVWIFDLVTGENPRIHALMWSRYREFLTGLGGSDYADKVFAYIEREDTPASLTFQLDLLREVGFNPPDVLHKSGPFAAFGASKA